jgi:hypothetical protein
MSPLAIARAFVDQINSHDIAGLAALMCDDHLFIDPGGDEVRGRDSMCQAWAQYFRIIPDYWVRIDHVLDIEETVALFGLAGGTYARDGRLDRSDRWEIPAAWRAVIREDRVAVWQVYADNEPLRKIMDRR